MIINSIWFRLFGQDASHAIAEIVILWLILYMALKTIRGTRAMQIIYFFAFLLFFTSICKELNLLTVYWFLTTAQLPIFVGLVILYAPELRRAVSELTQQPLFRRTRKKDDPTVAEVAKAAQVLSRRHIGALIVFERLTNLQGFIDTGIPMDSQVSSELLISIFSPLTPLHDGAVIIREGRVAAAACLLPLSQREEIDSSLGMRHRAALGLAEETDAVTVVVSEETGAVSIAINSRFTRELEHPRFQYILGKLVQGGGR